MKRFFQPACRLYRLPKSLADRTLAVGLLLIFAVFFSWMFLTTTFAAAPLLPKRTVPQRAQSQTDPGRIVRSNRTSDSHNYPITKDSLIQQVTFDDESIGRMVPPAPPLRKPLESESLLFSQDILSESEPSSSDDDFEEENSLEQTEEDDFADFPPLDVSQYKFPPITESPAVSESHPVSPSPSPPSTFVSDLSSGGLASFPLTMNGTQYPSQVPVQTAQPQQALLQGMPLPLGQVHYPNYNNGVNSAQVSGYPAGYAAGYGYQPPYAYYQNAAAYANPYGYGPYGYPNAPGAYWGPTGFVSNPYAAAQMQYPAYPYGSHPYGSYPYGGRPASQVADEDGSESLTSTMWETLGYFNPLKSPKGPNRGVGGPLMMRSWRDRPFYIGAFGGLMTGSELVSGLVDQENGGTGGIMVGWYADNYWGLESRLHFAGLPGKNTPDGRTIYEEWYLSQNKDAATVPLTGSRNNAISMFDVSIHYYPLGNAKWRPFLKLGLGTANQQFRDMYGVKHEYNSFMIPWGIGLKYWWNERIALHMELTDNVIFAVEEAKTQNNVAITVGLNFPIGKVKRKDPVIYWPMMPSSGR